MSPVLFDLDGTLTDPYVGITTSLCQALKRMGRPAPDPASMRWCIGPPIQEIIPKLLGNDDASEAQRCLVLFRERFSAIGLFENEPYPGVKEALVQMAYQGRPLFLATSKPTPFATRILDHFGLADYFSGVYGSNFDGSRTNKAEVIAATLEKEGLSNSAIMVGDRDYDVIGAHCNGIRCVGVLYGYGDRSELETAGADALCERPSQIVEALNRMVLQPGGY